MKTTSPKWRSVVASAATAAALFAAPLAATGTAYAVDNPYPPSPCPTHTTYPPYPPKPHGYGDDYGDEHEGDCDNGQGNGHGNGHGNGGEGHGNGHGDGNGSEGGHHPGGSDNGHQNGRPDKPHLAHTGEDNTTELVLGGVAAGLVALGGGALLVARRRSNS